MPTGLASLVPQASAPFTVLLGAMLLGERVSGRQLIGIGLAVTGMGLIAWDRALTAALLPVLLTLLAALGCVLGNLGPVLPARARRRHRWGVGVLNEVPTVVSVVGGVVVIAGVLRGLPPRHQPRCSAVTPVQRSHDQAMVN